MSRVVKWLLGREPSLDVGNKSDKQASSASSLNPSVSPSVNLSVNPADPSSDNLSISSLLKPALSDQPDCYGSLRSEYDNDDGLSDLIEDSTSLPNPSSSNIPLDSPVDVLSSPSASGKIVTVKSATQALSLDEQPEVRRVRRLPRCLPLDQASIKKPAASFSTAVATGRSTTARRVASDNIKVKSDNLVNLCCSAQEYVEEWGGPALHGQRVIMQRIVETEALSKALWNDSLIRRRGLDEYRDVGGQIHRLGDALELLGNDLARLSSAAARLRQLLPEAETLISFEEYVDQHIKAHGLPNVGPGSLHVTVSGEGDNTEKTGGGIIARLVDRASQSRLVVGAVDTGRRLKFTLATGVLNDD